MWSFIFFLIYLVDVFICFVVFWMVFIICFGVMLLLSICWMFVKYVFVILILIFILNYGIIDLVLIICWIVLCWIVVEFFLVVVFCIVLYFLIFLMSFLFIFFDVRNCKNFIVFFGCFVFEVIMNFFGVFVIVFDDFFCLLILGNGNIFRFIGLISLIFVVFVYIIVDFLFLNCCFIYLWLMEFICLLK